jgi:hypothetical protein
MKVAYRAREKNKIFILIFLILTVLASWRLITSENTRTISPKAPIKNGQAPIRKVDKTLAQNQHDQLFSQLRKFAEKKAFAIRISQTPEPPGENYIVEMLRDDITATGLDKGESGIFEIGFYNANEALPVPTQVFDELIVDLKRFIEEIPNTEFRYILDPIP